MTAGRKPGSGKAHQRILEVLRALGTTTDGRPVSIRASELAERAAVERGSLSTTVQPLLRSGQVTRCLIRPTVGNQTYEYRLGAGLAPSPFAALKTGPRAGIALGQPGKPLPVTTPAPPVSTPPRQTTIKVPVLRVADRIEDDAELLVRLQGMSEAEFGDYISHLARVWSWSRADRMVATAMAWGA